MKEMRKNSWRILISDTVSAQKLNLVLESDASQETAIVAAESEECTVVRGPPGTGKSQAIVNLIANALAEKKKVLLVCQKRVPWTSYIRG